MSLDESPRTGQSERGPRDERWYLTDEREFLQRSLADAHREREKTSQHEGSPGAAQEQERDPDASPGDRRSGHQPLQLLAAFPGRAPVAERLASQ